MITTTYTEARERLAELLELAVNDCEVVEIRRRGRESVAMIAMSELRSLLETAYLLQSPQNAERLLTALNRAQNKTGDIIDLDDLDKRLKRVGEARHSGTIEPDTSGATRSRKRIGKDARITALP